MTDLDSLVRELLALDPALAAREADVRALAQAMLRGRPDASWRPEFRYELRARLDAEILRRSRPSSWARALSSLGFLLAGAAATAAVAVVVRPDFFAAPRPAGILASVSGPSVTKREPGAFGTLAYLEPSPESVAADPSVTREGAGPSRMMAKAAVPEIASLMASDAAPAPSAAFAEEPSAPLPVSPQVARADGASAPAVFSAREPESGSGGFVYTGALDLPVGHAAVYRLVPFAVPSATSAVVARALSAVGVPFPADGSLDSAAYSLPGDSRIFVTVEVSPGRIAAYFADGSRDSLSSAANSSAQATSVTDAQALAAVDALLRRLGIDPRTYGAPSVRRSGPDFAQAAYPVLVAGLPVFDQSGDRRELVANVDLRTVRVTEMNGETSRAWESSDYPVFSAEEVRVFIARGGLSGLMPAPGESLGKPFRALTANSIYESDPYVATLVPTLVFPVLGGPAGEPTRYVWVPLVAPVPGASTK